MVLLRLLIQPLACKGHKCRAHLTAGSCSTRYARSYAARTARQNRNVRRHLVFLALTRAGLDELRNQFGRLPSPLWVSDGVLSQAELGELRANGADVTNFSYSIGSGDTAAIEDALGVIAEHHPGQRIWVERQSDV